MRTKNSLLKPPALPAGGRLGIVATASPIDGVSEELVQRGYERLRDMGYEVVEAPNCRTRVGHTAGTVRQRAQALHRFFRDPEIDGILAFWGGLQSHQLLEHLDYDLIRANPKPLVGYSDLTPLLNTITARSKIVTFHGPAAITFCKPILFDYSVDWFRTLLVDGSESVEYRPPETVSTNAWWKNEQDEQHEQDEQDEQDGMIERESGGWRAWRSGEATGPIMGGNLGSLLVCAGTPWWPRLDGALLFVEEDEAESPETVDRMFTQLRQMGVFDRIAGLVVGRFPDTVAFTADDSFEVILERAMEGYDLPVLLDCDFGHTDPILTLPLGVECTLQTDPPRLALAESAVRSTPHAAR